MNRCPFCYLDTSTFYNEIIDETKNFYVIPGVGALTPGYLLILPKKHVYSMTSFSKETLEEYNNLLNKYRHKFQEIYHKYPIIFEHGTPDPCGLCASCVIHAHTHIFNHNYKEEDKIIKELNLKKINSIFDIKEKNYIYYQSPSGTNYITYNFEPISQIMRIYIAKDLGIEKMYNWKTYPFNENIKKTISAFKTTKALDLMQYGKTKGALYLQKYLPKLTPFTEIHLVSDLSEWLNIKDNFDERSFIRPDTPIGEKMVQLEGSDGMLSSVPKMIAEMKEKNPHTALLIAKTKGIQIPRYLDDGGFVVLFDMNKKVTIEFVGHGFDGRELTHGIAVHESIDIPWDKILFVRNRKDLKKHQDIKSFIIDQKNYEQSRESRINFLIRRCHYRREILEKNIPTSYTPINDSILVQVFDDIILELYKKQNELLKDNLTYFCIQGNIINKNIEPWEISTLDRLNKKLES